MVPWLRKYQEAHENQQRKENVNICKPMTVLIQLCIRKICMTIFVVRINSNIRNVALVNEMVIW